jgi:hypothetical protein
MGARSQLFVSEVGSVRAIIDARVAFVIGEPKMASILVVDDDEMLRRALCRGFESRRHVVFSAATGEQAIEIGRRLISWTSSSAAVPPLRPRTRIAPQTWQTGAPRLTLSRQG